MKYAIKLNVDTTFEDAVRALSENGNGFLALIDHDEKLLGILTDGDIRRAILDKKTVLTEILNKNPDVLHYESSEQKILNHLKKIHRRQMPLVDGEGRYRGVFTLDDVDFNAKPNKVVIMAGGLGSRLHELTETTPKPMLHIGGNPILEHIVLMFAEKGFLNFIICVNYKREIIVDYFGDGDRLGVNIEYIDEDKRMGTAGALSLITDIPADPFFVINGDVFTTIDLDLCLAEHIKKRSKATMCIRSYSYEVPFGVVETDSNNSICAIKEKPLYSHKVNAGIYIIDPELITIVPKNQFYDMPQLFEEAIRKGMITSTFEITDYWLDIGRQEDYEKANSDYLRRQS